MPLTCSAVSTEEDLRKTVSSIRKDMNKTILFMEARSIMNS